MKQPQDLFTFQRHAMPVLLGWSVGSILAGLFWLRSRLPFWQGLGAQFAGWGVINGLIAALGYRGAVRSAIRLEAGEITPSEHARQQRQFEGFVWLNAILDVGYILGGLWLSRRDPANHKQRGTGWGVVIQGVFLWAWDIALGLLIHQQRRAARD